MSNAANNASNAKNNPSADFAKALHDLRGNGDNKENIIANLLNAVIGLEVTFNGDAVKRYFTSDAKARRQIIEHICEELDDDFRSRLRKYEAEMDTKANERDAQFVETFRRQWNYMYVTINSVMHGLAFARFGGKIGNGRDKAFVQPVDIKLMQGGKQKGRFVLTFKNENDLLVQWSEAVSARAMIQMGTARLTDMSLKTPKKGKGPDTDSNVSMEHVIMSSANSVQSGMRAFKETYEKANPGKRFTTHDLPDEAEEKVEEIFWSLFRLKFNSEGIVDPKEIIEALEEKGFNVMKYGNARKSA